MKKQERKLQIEHQRLLIEQQTFSATPQIASRAVAELGMYSPTLKDKLIIQPGVATALAPVVSDDDDELDLDVVGPRASTDISPEEPVAEAGQ